MPDPHCSTIGQGDADPHMFHGRRRRSTRRRAGRLSVLAAGALSCLAVLAATPATASASDPVVTVEETVTTPVPGTTVTITRTSTSTPTPSPAAATAPSDPLCAPARTALDDDEPRTALTEVEQARTEDPDKSDPTSGGALCAPERTEALEMLAEEPSGWAADTAAEWNAFAATWITPLVPGVLTAAGWFALLFVVSIRVFALVRPPSVRLRFPWVPGAHGALSAILLVAALVLLLGRIRASYSTTADDAQSLTLWLLGALLLILAAASFAAFVTGRMRVAVAASDDGAPDDARTRQFVALLARVGGSPPAGVEMPRGSDVTSLEESALLPAPAGALAKTALALVSGLLGGRPWSVSLDFTGSDSAAVVVSRNGRVVQAAILLVDDRSVGDGVFGADDDESRRIALSAMAAGTVMVALSRVYPGFEGLSGATDGRSVGLQYLATTMFARDRERSEELLSRALQIDPGNRAADIALQHLLHREATSVEELSAYRDSLLERAKSMVGQDDMRLLEQRVLMTYFAVLVNLRSATTSAKRPEKIEQTFQRMRDLLAETRDVDRTREQDPLLVATAARFADVEQGVREVYGLCQGPKEPGGWYGAMERAARRREQRSRAARAARPPWRALDPAGAYNSALVSLETKGTADVREADLRFSAAFTSLEHRRWARRDPELARLRHRDRVNALLRSDDPERLWDLALFAPHRLVLRGAGFTTPLALADAEVTDELVTLLGVSKVRVGRILDGAALADRVMSAPAPKRHLRLAGWRIDLAEILLGSATAPSATAPSAAAVTAALRARGLGDPPLREEVVAAWLASVFPPPPPPSKPERMRGLPLALSIDLRSR